MGKHLIDGQFQSDKYPSTPCGLVPLKPPDPMAQDLLWEYAQRRRAVDPEFSDDLEEVLRLSGYDHDATTDDPLTIRCREAAAEWVLKRKYEAEETLRRRIRRIADTTERHVRPVIDAQAAAHAEAYKRTKKRVEDLLTGEEVWEADLEKAQQQERRLREALKTIRDHPSHTGPAQRAVDKLIDLARAALAENER